TLRCAPCGGHEAERRACSYPRQLREGLLRLSAPTEPRNAIDPEIPHLSASVHPEGYKSLGDVHTHMLHEIFVGDIIAHRKLMLVSVCVHHKVVHPCLR